MIPAYLVDWVQGHVDHARIGIEGTLCDLARVHCDPELEKEFKAAAFALNRANNILATKRRIGK